jgi:CDP-glucose 4,6-dehydratase
LARALEDLVMFGDIYAGRRVFVTGHTGFKGSWLTQWLLDLGADVTGYSLEPPTEPNLFDAAKIGTVEAKRPMGAGRFTDLRADVRERRPLGQALEMAAPEIIFHLAAQPLVRHSYAEPHLTFETNVMGTVNLLEEVRALAAAGRSPRAVINVTSDKCYENSETGHAYAEGDPLGGFDPYSSSKGCSELVTASYRRSFFSASGMPRVASARAGNVIGGGDWGEDRILPDCARALSAGTPVEVRNPGAVRPWQHVLESLSGYLALGANLWRSAAVVGDEGGAFDGAWNFGPGAACNVTVREVVELFTSEWGGGEWRPAAGAARQPHEAGLLILDAGKAERELGWRAAWSVAEAVAAAAHWYREFFDGADASALLERCRGDIAAYCEAAARAGSAGTAAEAPA